MSEENSSWNSGGGESSFFSSSNSGEAKENGRPFQFFEGESIKLGGYLIVVVFVLYPLISLFMQLTKNHSQVNETLSIENKVQQVQVARPKREVPQSSGLISKLFCGGGLKRSSFCP